MDFIFSNGVTEGGSTFFVNNMYDFDLITDFGEKRFNKNLLNPKNLVALFRVLGVLKNLMPRMRGRYDDQVDQVPAGVQRRSRSQCARLRPQCPLGV